MDLLIQIMVFMFIITLVIMVINQMTIHFIFYCYGLEMFWNCCYLDSFINYRINICLFSNICYCCFIIIRDFIIRRFINLGYYYYYYYCIEMNFVGLVIRYSIMLNVKNHHFISCFMIFYESCLC